MPLVQAFPLGLVLIGTTSAILADGSSREKLLALGRITLGERTEAGIILLGGNQSDVLVGMQFLRVFQRTLLLAENGFFLIDSEEVKKAVQHAYQELTSQLPAPEEPKSASAKQSEPSGNPSAT